MFQRYLSADEVNDLVDRSLAAGFADTPTARGLLLDGLPRWLIASLPFADSLRDRLHSDLTTLNGLQQLLDGTVPLEVWPRNAARRVADRPERRAVVRFGDRVRGLAPGAPPELPPEPPPAVDVPEVQLFGSAYLTVRFLTAGAEFARTVARLRVPQYVGGRVVPSHDDPTRPSYATGTGWLIAPDLLVTAWHVVNARQRDEPPADQQDLDLQVRGLVAEFDVDEQGAPGVPVASAGLAASDPALDVAIIRLAAAVTDRQPATLCLDPLAVGMAVNVVQHPGGLPKKLCLPNGHLHQTTAREVQYFSDEGSSGAAVCDDRWRVVALHRAGRYFVTPLTLRGRTFDAVNVGGRHRR